MQWSAFLAYLPHKGIRHPELAHYPYKPAERKLRLKEVKMSTVAKRIRNTLKHHPTLALGLRAVREEWKWRTSKTALTPYGFRLAGNRAMQDGSFEPEETKLIRGLSEQFDVLIDVGANIGYYACLALHARKRIVAFEPLHENLRWLYRNLDDNGWTDAEIWPIGLANAPGLMVLYGGGTGASFVKGWAGISHSFKRFVPVNTLDNILANRFLNERLLIKVDVEGAELDVLKGAIRMLTRNAIWMIEITLCDHRTTPNPRFSETFEVFWRHGYSCVSADNTRIHVTKGDIQRWVTSTERALPTNWLFTPTGHSIS
jgi:FkbM family methyltransferase